MSNTASPTGSGRMSWLALHQTAVAYLITVLLVAAAFVVRGVLTSALAPQFARLTKTVVFDDLFHDNFE